eukprot:6145904-Amphidinium_carterae.1
MFTSPRTVCLAEQRATWDTPADKTQVLDIVPNHMLGSSVLCSMVHTHIVCWCGGDKRSSWWRGVPFMVALAEES